MRRRNAEFELLRVLVYNRAVLVTQFTPLSKFIRNQYCKETLKFLKC